MTGGGKSSRASGSRQLEAFAGELRTESRPGRRELFGQIFEALRTGGIGARLPIIQRAVESSMGATSQALRETEDRLRGVGLEGTPFGQRILSDVTREGEFATSQIPTNIAQELINLAPSFITGAGQTATGAGGAATAANARVQSANVAAQAQILSSLILGASGAGAAGGAAVCWIAYALYGPTDKFVYAFSWVNGPMLRSKLGKLAHKLYLKIGPTIAKYPVLCQLLKPLFDRAVSKGMVMYHG